MSYGKVIYKVREVKVVKTFVSFFLCTSTLVKILIKFLKISTLKQFSWKIKKNLIPKAFKIRNKFATKTKQTFLV